MFKQLLCLLSFHDYGDAECFMKYEHGEEPCQRSGLYCFADEGNDCIYACHHCKVCGKIEFGKNKH